MQEPTVVPKCWCMVPSLKGEGQGHRQRLEPHITFLSTHGTFASSPLSINVLFSPKSKCISIVLCIFKTVTTGIYSYLHCRQSSTQCTTGYCLSRQHSLLDDTSASIFYFIVFVIGKWKNSLSKIQFQLLHCPDKILYAIIYTLSISEAKL